MLRSRWTLGAVAFVAFALVAWFTGDTLLLGAWRPLDAPEARAILILLAAAAWIALEIRRSRRARRESERLLDLLAGKAGDSAARAAHEVEILRQRFEEAATILKRTRFKGPDGEDRYVHELPWYVFIGAPGSGKTTALVNAGLRFPLPGAGGDPALAGVGGTRNCDWWFTDEAVLLDTAGRYTTQESDREADAAAWSGFLDLLKRFRPRQPLNGALVTLSISDLMRWSDEERARYAALVRTRLAELNERLGARFPVYLLVTKSDLLAGFTEFFGEIDSAGRERVWGATFDYADERDSGSPGARFAGDFVGLEHRLNAELCDRLQQEPDLQRRAAIYRFPQEFHGTGPLIGQFIDGAFGAAGEGSAALLRGVYFTSGTQEGSPIDRVLGSLARSFGLERAAVPAMSGSGKSFFLKRLLREVIFAESGLASVDAAVERRNRMQRRVAYAAIAALGIALAVAWTASFTGNNALIEAAAGKAAGAKAEVQALGAVRAGQEAQLIRTLSALRELSCGAADHELGKRLAPDIGLGQCGKLGAQAQRAYRNALREAFIPHLALSLEEELRTARGRERIGEALEAYVNLHDGAKSDARLIEAAAARIWQLPPAARTELLAHLRSGLAAGTREMQLAPDAAIIRDARQRLAATKT